MSQSMERGLNRSTFLRVFLLFLTFTALIACAAVIAGEFGETVAKILASTTSISFASVAAMACSVFDERRPDNPLGRVGIATAGLAAALLIFGVWGEIDSETYWKSTLTFALAAGMLAHLFLLLLPKLDARYRLAQTLSTLLILVLLTLLTFALWKNVDASWYYRVVGVVSIGVGLFTLGIPIAWKLSADEPTKPSAPNAAARASDAAAPASDAAARASDASAARALALRFVEGNVYEDVAGRRYTVTPIDEEP